MSGDHVSITARFIDHHAPPHVGGRRRSSPLSLSHADLALFLFSLPSLLSMHKRACKEEEEEISLLFPPLYLVFPLILTLCLTCSIPSPFSFSLFPLSSSLMRWENLVAISSFRAPSLPYSPSSLAIASRACIDGFLPLIKAIRGERKPYQYLDMIKIKIVISHYLDWVRD